MGCFSLSKNRVYILVQGLYTKATLNALLHNFFAINLVDNKLHGL